MDTATTNTRQDTARRYTAAGWRCVPVPPGEKGPRIKGWQNLRLDPEQLDAAFAGPGNIGILLGEPSGWLVDIDLDCEEAVRLADQYLPPTDSVTGRASNPRSHRWYVAAGIESSRLRDPVTGDCIVEIRSTGEQTLVGPSVHPESGETYDQLDGQPAVIDAAQLGDAVKALYEAVLRERYPGGLPPTPERPLSRGTHNRPPGSGSADAATVARAGAYLDRMPGAVSGQGGHNATYAAACVLCHGFGLDEPQAVDLLQRRFNPRCHPPWSEPELRHKVQDALTKPHSREFGWLRDAGADLGGVDLSGLVRQMKEPVTTAAVPAGEVLPVVRLATDEHRVVEQTVRALSRDPALFRRGLSLVRVLRGEDRKDQVRRAAGSATISIVPPANLRERMTRWVEFRKRSDKGDWVPAHPPAWLVNAVDARGEWPEIRELVGVSDAPVLRPDGSVWQTPGYDPVTRVLYEPAGEFPAIPDSIGRDLAVAATETLLEIVEDFRFETPEHRAAWLAALLTPLARFAYDGPSPLFLIDANIRGAGKGLLAQTVARVVLGREMPVSSYAHDTDEMRKKVTCIAIAGDRLVLLDNLEGKFGNDTLDRALTSTRWRDRILGRSEQVELPLMAVWYATGNNVAVGADTTRRVIHIRLDVLEEKPEDRSDFTHPNLLDWIDRHRPGLLSAALTVIAGYLRAGCPPQALKPYGSFEGWSGLVRSAVVWAGLPDPCLTRDRLVEHADTSENVLLQLVRVWRGANPCGDGVVLSRLIGHLYPAPREPVPNDAESVAWREAIEGLVGCPPGKTPTARQLGNRLKSFRRRVVDGVYLDSNPNEYERGGAVWRLYDAVTKAPACESAVLPV